MKYLLSFSFILILFFVACQTEKNDTAINTDSISKNIEVPIPPQSVVGNNFTLDLSTYKEIYEYNNINDKTKQTLAINREKNNTISYSLSIVNKICQMEYKGTAKNLHPNGDSEIDEDEEGAYPVEEYFAEEKEYDLSIRLALDSTKAKIIFTNKILKGQKTCQPSSDYILRKDEK